MNGKLTVVGLSLLAFTACQSDEPSAPVVDRNVAPAFATSLAGARLIVTEVHGNPAGGEVNGAGEWFEVFNAGDVPFAAQTIQLSMVTGSGALESASVAVTADIQPGQYVVFARAASTPDVPAAPILYTYGTIIFNNANSEILWLRDAAGATIDSLAFGKRSATGTIIAPSISPPDAITRALRDLDADGLLDLDENGNGVCDDTEDGRIIGNNTFWETSTSAPTYANGANRGTPGTGPFTAGGVACGQAPGPVVTVVVTPNPATVNMGSTRQLTASGRDTAGITSPTTFTWSSDNPAVATVNTSGLVSGASLGSATITATAANGVTGTATVNVVQPQAADLNIFIPSANHAPVGFVKRALLDLFDADGNRLPTTGVVFSVTNPVVASIDQRGYVTALTEGITFLKAVAPNGISDSTFYQVNPPTAPTSAVYRNHVEFGAPADGNPADDILITKAQLVLSYSALKGGPNWVAWNLNASHFGAEERCDCFTPDAQLPANVYHVEDFDYVGSGYNRGHMTMSENRTTTEQENAATFYFTNILPQSTANNSGPWLRFETHLNDRARLEGKEVYIVAGGLYRATPPTLKNEGKVQVPDYTWKIAVIMNAGAGLAQATSLSALEVIAIKVPNDTTPGGPASSVGIGNLPWQNFQVTVDALEAETGYDFLALLRDDLERILEANDRPPTARITGAAASVEGTTLAFDGSTSTDPDNDALTYAWDFGDGATATGSAPTHAFADNGTFQVKLTVSDPLGATHTATHSVTLANALPVIDSANVPAAPLAIGSPFAVRVRYSDAGSADTHQLHVDWGDGSTDLVDGLNGLASAAHTFSAAGFYTITLTIEDDDGGRSATHTSALIVVFDPARNIGGGGWFLMNGQKAHVNINLDYDGSTASGRLDLHSPGLRFESNALEWVVVSGNRATVQGSANVRGSTEVVAFTAVFTDGEDGQDRVRLIVRNASGGIVFDSQPGEPLSAAPAALLNGSFTVR